MNFRSIYAALAIPALALSLTTCAVPPELALLKPCGDGTFCPIEAACYATAECLRCEAVLDLSSWTSCGADLCPREGGCTVDRSACMRDCHRTASDRCGNGQLDGTFDDDASQRPLEECDDGNLLDGDGCDHACRRE